MITLLIEDRRHGADELAEVHVLLKAAGEGYLLGRCKGSVCSLAKWAVSYRWCVDAQLLVTRPNSS
jgi:hypothetical protein